MRLRTLSWLLALAFCFDVSASEWQYRFDLQRALDLVNQARATPRHCGNTPFRAAPPVQWSGLLAESVRHHAEDMARYSYFSHSGRDGSQPWDRAEREGYRSRAFGENIAAGQRSLDEAVVDWIRSPQHCANLMNPAFAEMGVAAAFNRGNRMGVVWAQAFGTRR